MQIQTELGDLVSRDVDQSQSGDVSQQFRRVIRLDVIHLDSAWMHGQSIRTS